MPIYHWLIEKLVEAIESNDGPLKDACILAQGKMEEYKELSNTEANWIAVG